MIQQSYEMISRLFLMLVNDSDVDSYLVDVVQDCARLRTQQHDAELRTQRAARTVVTQHA